MNFKLSDSNLISTNNSEDYNFFRISEFSYEHQTHLSGGNKLLMNLFDNKLFLESTNFTSKPKKSYFEELNFLELKQKLENFKKFDDWGEDLTGFKELNKKLFTLIESKKYTDKKFLYFNLDQNINSDIVDKHVLIYYVCIIIIVSKQNRIVTLELGED